MMNNIYFLSGLPRTGSTLLTSILSQNPKIHTDSNSPLCQLMWDMKVSTENTEQMFNKKQEADNLISSIPKTFYEDIEVSILDKCRSWTIPENLDLINNYITSSPKIIVMVRPIIDIVKSFVYIRTLNGWKNPEEGLLDQGSEPIMRSLYGVNYATKNNNGEFIFIQYDDLIEYPSETINKIYEFCEWEKFNHSFTKIKNKNIENDSMLKMIGLHDIRSELSRRKINIKLSDDLYEKALMLDKVGAL